MTLQQLANEKISRSKNTEITCFPDGNTNDIIKVVLEWHNKFSDELKAFAPHLQGNDNKETARNIWYFLKGNIKYKKDPDGQQWIKSPARVWADKFCDCKSYAVFIASVLTCLKIPCIFRFVSFDKNDRQPTHVYIVLPYRGGEVIIDDVMGAFNTEAPYTYKTDYMTQIKGMNGLGNNGGRIRRINGFGGTLNLGEGEISGGLSTLLNAGQRQKVLNDALPDLVMLALYMYIPAGPDGAGPYKEVHSIFASDKNYLQLCPSIVSRKRDLAFASFWNFGDWAGIKVENDLFPKIKTLITAKLGSDPMQWWMKKFSDAGIGSTPTSAPATTGGGLTSITTGLSAALPYMSFVTSALGIVGKLFGGSDIQWKYGTPDTWAPAAADWNSFKFNPLIAVDTSYSAPGTSTTATVTPPINTGIPVLDTAINAQQYPLPGLTYVKTGNAPWKRIYQDAAGNMVNDHGQPVDANGDPVTFAPMQSAAPATQTASTNIWLTVAAFGGVAIALLFGGKKKGS